MISSVTEWGTGDLREPGANARDQFFRFESDRRRELALGLELHETTLRVTCPAEVLVFLRFHFVDDLLELLPYGTVGHARSELCQHLPVRVVDGLGDEDAV